ncbi:hypothetical protein C8J57DRAFT_1266934 [Mycena rebaudengoi]|nr:hypothetical protein C8J57DRAFT_1266934 [Mycena rebaudengoi]
MSSNDHGAYLYHVMRHTNDQHNGGEHTEIRGTYTTLREANSAARVDLTKSWALDFFESHEVEVEDGMVTVTGHCPEGEIMTVYIEKKPVPAGSRAPMQAKAAPKKTAAASVRSDLKEVWIIIQTDFEHHTDEEGRSDVASEMAYESVQDANRAARYVLMDACGVEDDDEWHDIELEEENLDSTSEAYVGRATVREDDRDSIEVVVKRLIVSRASTASKSSAKGSNKKRRIEEDVIDISSD